MFEGHGPHSAINDFRHSALSHDDNRFGMTILAYNRQNPNQPVGRWEKSGARYVHAIKLTGRNVEFIGQAEFSVRFTLKELRVL